MTNTRIRLVGECYGDHLLTHHRDSRFCGPQFCQCGSRRNPIGATQRSVFGSEQPQDVNVTTVWNGEDGR